MSFNFNNINSAAAPMKAQASYKDGGGMGSGGMYQRQEQNDEDVFQSSDDNVDEIDSLFDKEIKEEDIESDTFFNKFVNWFRINKK